MSENIDEINYPIIINESSIDIEDIIDLLKLIFDPEIDYNLYDMGLFYGITIKDKKIDILMTLTSPSCPEAQTLPMNVKDIITENYPEYEVNVEVTFTPTWTVDNMTDVVKLKLGLL